jgi:hypothetical protein
MKAKLPRKKAPAITDTPAFKAWFGGSKVVDSGDRPMKMYHGTAREKRAWSPTRPAYFTPDYDDAVDLANMDGEVDGETPYVLAVYLSIKNPIRLGWEESNVLNVEPERVQSLIKDGYDGVFGVGDADDDVFEYIAFFPNQIRSAIEK